MFDFRNGKPLMDLLVPEGLSHAATSFVESLKINSITEKARRHRRVVIKRRFEIRPRNRCLRPPVTPMTCSFFCSIW